MQGAITYRILGALEVTQNGTILPITSPRQRTILACLLLRHGRAVSVERLVDRLWDERPPHTARAATQVHVGRLRRLLGDGARIETRPDGYVLDPPPDALDIREFDDLMTCAGAIRDSAPEESLALFRRALGLWRGPILSDVKSFGVDRMLWMPLACFGWIGLLVPLATPGWGLVFYVAGWCGNAFVTGVYNTGQVSYRQLVCPPELLGRANASIRWVVLGMAPLGGVAGGALANWLGPRPAMWAAMTATPLAGLWLAFSPLRRRRAPRSNGVLDRVS